MREKEKERERLGHAAKVGVLIGHRYPASYCRVRRQNSLVMGSHCLGRLDGELTAGLISSSLAPRLVHPVIVYIGDTLRLLNERFCDLTVTTP